VNRTFQPERQKIQTLITWKLLIRSRRNFNKEYAPQVCLRGWSHGSPTNPRWRRPPSLISEKNCGRERCSSDHQRFSLDPAQRDILPQRHSQVTTVSDLTIRLNTTTSLKSISLSQKLWLYHQLFKRSSDQFNLLDVNNVANHSSFSLVNRLQLTDAVTVIISSVHRHRLFIFSEINNGWSMTVTVLQLKASTQLIGLLLVPAIKGAVYINTRSI